MKQKKRDIKPPSEISLAPAAGGVIPKPRAFTRGARSLRTSYLELAYLSLPSRVAFPLPAEDNFDIASLCSDDPR